MVKKEKGFLEDFGSAITPPLVLGGGAIGASLLGSSLQNKLPAGTTNPLTTTGTTLGNFVAPVAVIGAGGLTLKQLDKTRRRLER